MTEASNIREKPLERTWTFTTPLCLFLSSRIPIPQPSIFNSSIYTSKPSKAPDSHLQIDPKKPWPLL